MLPRANQLARDTDNEMTIKCHLDRRTDIGSVINHDHSPKSDPPRDLGEVIKAQKRCESKSRKFPPGIGENRRLSLPIDMGTSFADKEKLYRHGHTRFEAQQLRCLSAFLLSGNASEVKLCSNSSEAQNATFRRQKTSRELCPKAVEQGACVCGMFRGASRYPIGEQARSLLIAIKR